MALFGPNKADLENANWVLRDRLGKPNQRTSEWPTNLPRTQEEFNQLIADAKKVVEENKGKYLPTEISEFEQLLSEYYAKTPGAQLNNLRNETGPVIPVASPEAPVVAKNLQELHTRLKKGNEEPMTVESVNKLLTALDTEKSPEARAIIINTLWSRLAGQKYNMTLQGGKISLENPLNLENAIAIEATLNNQLAAGKIRLNEIQGAIMTGTRKFGSYVDTQSADLTKASLVGYVDFLTKNLGIDLTADNAHNIKLVQSHSKATAEEKSFLITYLTGGYAGYDAVPDVQRKVELKKQNIELQSSAVFVATEKIVGTASAGKLATEKAAMKQGGKSEELTLDTFMDNPTLAIAKYPWTSLTLIIAGIWKFGFMKTIGGLLVGSIGLKALNEIGTETGLGKQIKDGLKKGAKVAGEAAEEALDSGKAAVASGSAALGEATKPAVTTDSINISKLNEYQKAGVLSIENNKSLLEDIANYPKQAGKDKQNADLSTYINTLHKDSIQNITLDKLIYTADHEQSIFSDTVKSQFGDNKDIPDTVSRYLLKKTIRSYIGINASLSMPTNNLKEGQQSLDDFKKKFPEDQWKNKTLKDLLNEVYKK